MTTELNPVLLQAQNIDLKQRLEAAEKKISDLRTTLSQNTVHIINPAAAADHGKLTAELESLRNASKGNTTTTSGSSSSTSSSSAAKKSSPNASETSKLQQQIDHLKKQLEEEQEKNQNLEVELEWAKEQQQQHQTQQITNNLEVMSGEASAVFSRQESSFGMSGAAPPPPPPPSSAPPPEALQALIDREREKREAAEKELASLRSKVAASNAEVFKWKNSAKNLQSEIDSLKKAAAASTSSSSSSSSSSHDKYEHNDAGHVDTTKALNEELIEQLQRMKKLLEESYDEKQKMRGALDHLQEELKIARTQISSSSASASASKSEASRISALEAQNVRLQQELDDEKLDNGSLTNEIATLRSTIAKVEDERAKERQLAAEAEFDRLLEGSDTEGQLRKQLRDAQEQRDKAVADTEKAQAEHLIMLRLKDKTLLQLNQTSEELIKAREHFQKREEDLLKQIQDGRISPKTPVTHQAPPSTPPPPPSTPPPPPSSPQILAGVVLTQEALQRDRDSAQRTQRKKELLDKLKAKTREDQATAEEIFTRTARAYDALLKQLREAHRDDSGKGQEEVYYDVLWEYERKNWHISNDYQSMRAIIDIKQSDMEGEVKRLREADETKLAILRMQLQDLGKTPQC